MRPCIACLLFIVSVHAFSQNEKDSLLAALKIADDTSKVLILHDLARLHIQAADSALHYTHMALSESESAGYENGKMRSYWILGLLYSDQGAFSKSIEYSKRSLVMLANDGDSLKISSVLNNLAGAYFAMGSWDEAIKYFLQALRIKERYGASKKQLAATYQNLGACYLSTGDLNAALAYSQKAVDLHKETANRLKEGDVMMNIALIYQEQKNREAARTAFAKTISLQKETGNLKGLANTYSGLGCFLREQRHYDSALFFLKKALTFADTVQNFHYKIMVTVNIARVLLDKEEYAQSIELTQKAMSGLDSLPALKLLRDVYQIQAEAYDKLGKSYEALLNYKMFYKLEDSLLNKEKLQNIHEMKRQYETEKKEMTLARLKAEVKAKMAQTKKSNLMALLCVIGILTLACILYLRARLHKRHLAQAEAEKLRKQYELEMKEQELSGLSMNVLVKNNTLKLIKEKISNGNGSYNAEAIKAIDNNLKFDKEWENFKVHFEKVHQGFFNRLKEKCPNITPNEQKLCAYLKLNFSTKEVSRISNVSISAVDKSRQRLRKKLDIDPSENLVSFIQEI
ncbi:hypothetical protein C900_02963 [Fulvivirga imtechensis AK7]|uniref:Uncharacterized protein n=1 Tax=Fulvivirga imtechensis AK7 TaxID=1237149 RepID=L8JUD1_9BACT|nr:tetratricopeptide repeat protein [Fulvivirga imtechensis]ELR71159.1 hypothetical protein C900_02963 [Fulvivirga imtechensis AK7]